MPKASGQLGGIDQLGWRVGRREWTLLAPGMVEAGAKHLDHVRPSSGADADRIVESCLLLVEQHGCREFYNPLNGEGVAARRFGWSTLIVDMLPAVADGVHGRIHSPFQGSVRDELWARGVEAFTATRRAGASSAAS